VEEEDGPSRKFTHELKFHAKDGATSCWEKDIFVSIRQHFEVPEDFVAKDLVWLDGNTAQSTDQRFNVRKLSDSEWDLLVGSGGIIDALFMQQEERESSLLPRFLAVCKEVGKNWVGSTINKARWAVEYNWLRPKLHPQSWTIQVDLKGEADRFQDQDYYTPVYDLPEGKDANFGPYQIWVSKERRGELISALEKDLQFLSKHKITEYSLQLRLEVIGQCDRVALGTLCPKGIEWHRFVAADGWASEGCPLQDPPLGDAAPDKLHAGLFEHHRGYLVGVRDNVLYAYSFGLVDTLKTTMYQSTADAFGKNLLTYVGIKAEWKGADVAEEGDDSLARDQLEVRDPTCECAEFHGTNIYPFRCDVVQKLVELTAKDAAVLALALAWLA